MDRKQNRRTFIERLCKKAAVITGGAAVASIATIAASDDVEAGCAWYYTGYSECRPEWRCFTSGVARFYQQAYYCSDRNPGPLAYRFIRGECGC